MSIARKILANTIWQILGKVVMAFMGLLVLKIATHYLSVEGYGEYVLIYEFLAFFGIAADLGLFTIAVREMSKNDKDIPKILGNILSLRTFLVLITMLTAIVIGYLIPDYRSSHISLGIAIASATVFLTIINGTLTSVLQVKLKMHISSIASMAGKAVSVATMGYIVFFGFPEQNETGFYMLIVAGIFGALVTLWVTHTYVKKITPIKYRFDFDLWKKVVKEALPYGLALILNTIYFRVDSLLISFIRGQEEVGIYGVAMKMLEHFSILPLYFMNSVLPVLTKALNEKSARYKEIISQSFNFLAAMSVPMVVGGVVLAYPIVFIVSTPDFLSRLNEGFYGSDIAFKILIFALLFQFLNVLFAFILIAVNKQIKLLYINAICVAFNLATNLICIPYYGFVGASVTSVLSELFILGATYYYAKKYIDFGLNMGKFVKIIFSSIVMGLCVYELQKITYNYVENWNVFLLIPVGAFVYVFMLFITKTVDKEMLRLLRKGESKPHDGSGI